MGSLVKMYSVVNCESALVTQAAVPQLKEESSILTLVTGIFIN